ncbi:MAG: TVP38/TMEM64 family protein [Lachnospiraceae bacterium]|nr:TVP38/TMEM64 family protein [Lachnospiraceae bacterium]
MTEKIRELTGNDHTVRIIKRVVVVVVVAVLLFTFVYLIRNFIPGMIQLLKDGEPDQIGAYLRSQGKIGVVILVALQVLQTITIVFPGIPIYVAAGIVYGKFWGMVICYLTYVISNSAVFLFARKMGAVSEMILSGRKKKKEGEEVATSLLQRTKYPGYITAALCVIPVVPNGLVPYIAAKTEIPFKRFLLSIAIGCFPGILLFIWCGSMILDGHIGVVIAMCFIGIGCFILFLVFKKRLFAFFNNKILSRFARPEKTAEEDAPHQEDAAEEKLREEIAS